MASHLGASTHEKAREGLHFEGCCCCVARAKQAPYVLGFRPRYACAHSICWRSLDPADSKLLNDKMVQNLSDAVDDTWEVLDGIYDDFQLSTSFRLYVASAWRPEVSLARMGWMLKAWHTGHAGQFPRGMPWHQGQSLTIHGVCFKVRRLT